MRFPTKNVLAFAGWGLFVLLALFVAPRVYHRLVVKLPFVKGEEWVKKLSAKEEEISESQWKDERPLNIITGDSHIESGNWYDLLGGAYAVRNCGLGGAKIHTVISLVSAISDAHPRTVILMCGINDLSGGATPDACLKDYEQLILAVKERLSPGKIIVMSVMPVSQSLVDGNARKLNETVYAFDEMLSQLCKRSGVVFVDVNGAVSDSNRGLREDFTTDGLHLNGNGYKSVAKVLHAALDGTP